MVERSKGDEGWNVGHQINTRLTGLPKERKSDGTVGAIHVTPPCCLKRGRNGCKTID
jgi:hypothetical protein